MTTDPMVPLDLLMQQEQFHEMTRRRADWIQWAVVAESDDIVVMGKPIRIHVEWPEGCPFGQTPEQMRQLAREKMDQLRSAP